MQWYRDETAEALIHGLSQAFQKRGLPRALWTDNGAAMLAAETTEGLERLGIVHHTTLPYSPEQNGKQESFWAQVEGRLLPMLEGEPELTLDLLNTATFGVLEMIAVKRDDLKRLVLLLDAKTRSGFSVDANGLRKPLVGRQPSTSGAS